MYKTKLSENNKLSIVNRPDSVNYNRPAPDSITRYNEAFQSAFKSDLRCRNLTHLDLSNNLNELLHSDFDTKTHWPATLPAGFNPDEIMEISKNPGLNIRELHKMDVTGKGVGLAIIDQSLLTDHCEYKDQLRLYEEIHVSKGNRAQMHGPACASLAVGKTVGVAPEADLYYIASDLGSLCLLIKHKLFKMKLKKINPRSYVKSIYRILEINRSLPSDQKIRVISISFGCLHKDFLKAIDTAEKEGVFVISSVVDHTHNLKFHGLGRSALSNPDDYRSYTPGAFWASDFYNARRRIKADSTIMVPMDARCTASQSGLNSYAFYSGGGWSWSIPYIAGMYALACQVKPSLTPQEFWIKAIATGEIIEIAKNGQTYKLGTIVNPVKLIENLNNK